MDLKKIIADIVGEMQSAPDRGELASYIPTLALVDPACFCMAMHTADGNCYVGGDADIGFSIQSRSIVFSLALALGKSGDQLWQKVGRETSGTPVLWRGLPSRHLRQYEDGGGDDLCQ